MFEMDKGACPQLGQVPIFLYGHYWLFLYVKGLATHKRIKNGACPQALLSINAGAGTVFSSRINSEFYRKVFNAPLQAITWSSIAFTLFR